MAQEYRPRETVVDLYKILGLTQQVAQNPNCDQLIHEAYIAKVKKCHPDRYPGNARKAEYYTLITGAYDILRTASNRAAYNKKRQIADTVVGDHEALKLQYRQHIQTMAQVSAGTLGEASVEGAISPLDDKGYMKPTDAMKADFARKMKEMDALRGYDKDDTGPLDKKELERRHQELMNDRTALDEKLKTRRNPFVESGKKFDPRAFNAMFDRQRREPRTQMTLREGVPDGWRDDTEGYGVFSETDPVDTLIDHDPFSTGTRCEPYAPVADFPEEEESEEVIDLEKLTGGEYYHTHAEIGPDYYREMRARLRERKKDTEKFDKRKRSDYTTDTHGYGITDDPRLAPYLEDNDPDDQFVTRCQALAAGTLQTPASGRTFMR